MILNNTCNLPRNVTLQLTEACNLRCKMCYFWGETGTYSLRKIGKKPKALEIDVLFKLIKTLAPSKPFYSLFGGEPLLYPNLEELILAIKNAGSALDTPTNGTLLAEHAKMLVKTQFDYIRVSIDGPREVNDFQRGDGSYNKAMAGIETLHEEKLRIKSKKPSIEIIFTITPKNFDTIEQFVLKDLNLDVIDRISFQMENFLTEEMGLAYAKLIKSEFNIRSDRYWKGLVRSPNDFNRIDTEELARQVNKIHHHLSKMNKIVMFEPPTYSSENLSAYIKANWSRMTDQYVTCYVPWVSVDITSTGDLAPCHIFYDLVMGNLYEKDFEEIWNGKRYQKFRDYMNKNKLMPICPGCCILYLAGKKKRKRKK
ncbi:MAG: radical SAM protein [Promethearchaeota archaeon]|nr:MAG: radical SAM protein [Candidatus Lokiarchaeota archaeon]